MGVAIIRPARRRPRQAWDSQLEQAMGIGILHCVITSSNPRVVTISPIDQ